MRIVVTGAAGFVGSWIARELADQGHQVVGTFRSPPTIAARDHLTAHGNPVRLVNVDVTDRPSVEDLFITSRPEAVVHAAAQTFIAPDNEGVSPEEMIDINIRGAVNVVLAAGSAGVRRAIYLSTAGVFPPGSINDPPISEDQPPAPVRLYGITKHAAELLWRRFAELHGMSAASVRIVQPYGPLEEATRSREIMSPIYEWFLAARQGRPVLIPDWPAAKDWLFVGDTARAITLLVTADHLSHDLYHLGAGRLYDVSEVLEILRRFYPDMTTETVTDPGLINPNIGPFGLKGMLSIDRIREDVGFEPRFSLAQGLTVYQDWLSDSPYSETVRDGR